MEEIVIKDENGNNLFDMVIMTTIDGVTVSQNDNLIIANTSEAKQLAFGILQHLGISIDEIKRQAFEAGREKMGGIHHITDKYPTFEDYKNSEG